MDLSLTHTHTHTDPPQSSGTCQSDRTSLTISGLHGDRRTKTTTSGSRAAELNLNASFYLHRLYVKIKGGGFSVSWLLEAFRYNSRLFRAAPKA